MTNILIHIEEQLKLRHRNRQQIMENAIQERLNKSLATYDKELSLCAEHIAQKSELNVLKKL